MRVGDLVTCNGEQLGIITCVDPEEIGDNKEVEVLWTSGFTGYSTHSTWNLEAVSESR